MASEKVLIIDDSRLYREVLKRTLVDAGYEVSTAEDGQKGVEAARERGPDLIITDMDMPIMSGEDVCRSLKADSASSAATMASSENGVSAAPPSTITISPFGGSA